MDKKQLQHNRLTGMELICGACAQIGGVAKGRKIANPGEQDCAACQCRKTRANFDKKDLNNKQVKEKAGSSYTLVCLECKARERELLTRLESLDARLCPRSCGTQLFRHAEKCRAKFRVRLTEEDLEFLSFRPGTRTKYFVQDVAYYRKLGVLGNAS